MSYLVSRIKQKISGFGSRSHTRYGSRGFTLVEMMVAVALFAVAMLISVSTLLALVGANRKAQALQSVMNNLNIALDGMVRGIRMGSTYHCGVGTYSVAQDCQNGDRVLAFEAFGGDPTNPLDQWVYAFDTTGSICGKDRICKSEDSGAHFLAITAPEVSIESMTFYIVGTARGDDVQPKVVIEVKGTAGAFNNKTRTSFSIQATAVQRLLDL